MAHYFGVIGIRDYLKIKGKRYPFWEFLDQQPYGWLCSLAYKRTDILPEKQKIWDCGAWSYRKEKTPRLPKIGDITSSSALSLYSEIASEGDIVIAPDHMLIPNEDLDFRREFNRKSSISFLKKAKNTSFIPMACIHGIDIEEKIDNAIFLSGLGYSHLAIGGVAAIASKIDHVLEIVMEIKNAVPSLWLHVLGLSSPIYASAWDTIGINSFDGASHFRKAFTGGIFYEVIENKLVSKKISDNDIGNCTCLACSELAKEGIDTRVYGNSESNIGRAAHNMNMLMRVICEK